MSVPARAQADSSNRGTVRTPAPGLVGHLNQFSTARVSRPGRPAAIIDHIGGHSPLRLILLAIRTRFLFPRARDGRLAFVALLEPGVTWLRGTSQSIKRVATTA